MECSKGESHKMKEENNQNLEEKVRLSVIERIGLVVGGSVCLGLSYATAYPLYHFVDYVSKNPNGPLDSPDAIVNLYGHLLPNPITGGFLCFIPFIFFGVGVSCICSGIIG